jgi:hypothetical protein
VQNLPIALMTGEATRIVSPPSVPTHQVDQAGHVVPSRSQSSSDSLTPMRPATASRWTTAFVDPQIAPLT